MTPGLIYRACSVTRVRRGVSYRMSWPSKKKVFGVRVVRYSLELYFTQSFFYSLSLPSITRIRYPLPSATSNGYIALCYKS